MPGENRALAGAADASAHANAFIRRADEDGEYWMWVPPQNRAPFMASHGSMPGISLRQLLDIYGERCAQPQT